MKLRYYLLFFALSTSYYFSQKVNCGALKKDIYQSNKKYIDSLPKQYIFNIDCSNNENYEVVKLTKQNGNEYLIYEVVYNYYKNNYKQGFTYITYSNRQGENNYVELGDMSAIKDLDISKIEEKENNSLFLAESNNCQDALNGCVNKNYYLDLLHKNLIQKNKKRLQVLMHKFIAEKYLAISKEEIISYNNIAYKLYTIKMYNESIYLLQKILAKFPNRTVAYLNLADAYWDFGNKENAKENYKKYITLMKSQKKDIKKIPKRVFERIK